MESSDDSPQPAVDDDQEQLFIHNLVRFRNEKKMSQGAFAAFLREKGVAGMHQTTVSRMEKGERSVKLQEALQIASATGMSLDQMLMPTDIYEAIAQLRSTHLELSRESLNLLRSIENLEMLREDAIDVLLRLEHLEGDWRSGLDSPTLEKVEELYRNLEAFVENGTQGAVNSVLETHRLRVERDINDLN